MEDNTQNQNQSAQSQQSKNRENKLNDETFVEISAHQMFYDYLVVTRPEQAHNMIDKIYTKYGVTKEDINNYERNLTVSESTKLVKQAMARNEELIKELKASYK